MITNKTVMPRNFRKPCTFIKKFKEKEREREREREREKWERERERERVGERETEVRDVFIILTPQASFLERFVILKN